MLVDPGFHVYGNILYGKGSGVSTSIGIFAQGIDQTLRDSVMGPIINDNYIYGFSESMQLGSNPAGTDDANNIIAKDNYYSGVIDDNGQADNPNVVTGNIQIPTTTYFPRKWVGNMLAPYILFHIMRLK